MKKIIILISINFLATSCFKKEEVIEPIYKEEEFVKIASAFTQINPVGDNAIPYGEYSPKINKVLCKTYNYKRLKFYAIGFNSVIDAKMEAKRLNQYYSKNYVFDLVEGEPVLEDAMIEFFKAENPNRAHQRVPDKQHDESHGNTHDAHDAHSGHAEAPVHH
jgi:hypothetical protein